MLAILAAATALGGGAPHQVGQGLNCSLGFEGLVEQVQRLASAERQANPPSVPYITYTDNQTKTLYTFTTEGAVGHPGAIRRDVMAKADGVHVATSACGYSTRKAFDRMLIQFRDLNGKAREGMVARAAAK